MINNDLRSLGTLCFLLYGYPVCQEEQKRKEEEEQRRQENEVAFQSWLMRKREQIHDERRVQKAQEMEMMSCKVSPLDGAV